MEQARSTAASLTFTPPLLPAQGLVRVESKRQTCTVPALPMTGAAAAAPGPLPPRRVEPLPQTVRELRECIGRHPLGPQQVIAVFVSDRIAHALDRSQQSGTPVCLDALDGLEQALGGDQAKGADLSAVLDAIRQWRHRLPTEEVTRLVARLLPSLPKGNPAREGNHATRWDILLRPLYWPPGSGRAAPSFLASLFEQVRDPRQRSQMLSYLMRQIVAQLSDPIALAQPMAQRVRLRQEALDLVLSHFPRLASEQSDRAMLHHLADEIGGTPHLAAQERIALLADLLAPRAFVQPADRALLAGRVLAAVQRLVQAALLPQHPGPFGLGEILRILEPCARVAAPAGGLRRIETAAAALLQRSSTLHPSDTTAIFGVLRDAWVAAPPVETPIGPMERAFVQAQMRNLCMTDVPRARAIAAGLFGDLALDRSVQPVSDARTDLGHRIERRLGDLLPFFEAHDASWKLGVLVHEAARAARRLVDDGSSPVPGLVRVIARASAGFRSERQRVMIYALAVAWDRIDPAAQGRWRDFDAALEEGVQQEAVRQQPTLAPLVGARVTHMHASFSEEVHLLALACRIIDPDTPLREQVARAERMAQPVQRHELHRWITDQGLADLPSDGATAFAEDRFDAWHRATIGRLADFEAPVNDPMVAQYAAHRVVDLVPQVIPSLAQRLVAVHGAYYALHARAGLLYIHRLPDDASAREAARGARTALEAARVRIERIRADARSTLHGRAMTPMPELFQELDRQQVAVVRALQWADGPSVGAMDGADGPALARLPRDIRGPQD